MCGWGRVSFSKQGKLQNTTHNCYFPVGPHGGVALTPLCSQRSVKGPGLVPLRDLVQVAAVDS